MCVIAFFLLPETQGKTLTELATIYEKKKPKMYQPKVEPPWDLPISNKVIEIRYGLPGTFMLNSLVDLTNISKIVSPGVYCPGRLATRKSVSYF